MSTRWVVLGGGAAAAAGGAASLSTASVVRPVPPPRDVITSGQGHSRSLSSDNVRKMMGHGRTAMRIADVCVPLSYITVFTLDCTL